MRLASFRSKKYCKVDVSKGSRNVSSKYAGANFHMNLFVCVSADKYVALPLSTLPLKRLNMDVLKGCNIEGAHNTTATKGFINYTFLLKWM